MKKEDNLAYVVYWREALRDGHEDGAKVFSLMKEAIAMIDDMANRYADKGVMSIRLFQLGSEIQLNRIRIDLPQPSKIEVRHIPAV